MEKLNAAQAIRNAIEAEKAAERFYRLLAESTKDQEAKAFLSAMADSENGHAEAIETSYSSVFSGALAARADFDVSVVETLPDWKFIDNIALPQAAQMAITAEQQASLYYDALSDCFEEPLKGFFVELSKTETMHAEELHKKFSGRRAH